MKIVSISKMRKKKFKHENEDQIINLIRDAKLLYESFYIFF